MNSILNSVLSGELQVQTEPKVTPVKEDSIIGLLQSDEIEFKTCPKIENDLSDINTGFGENNDLHYDTPCKNSGLKTPLYRENYLQEFVTEEEKASARHALGLYNKGDVVAMSLLTAEDKIPSQSELQKSSIKQMRKGDVFFSPITSFNAVFDSVGHTLEETINDVRSLLTTHQKELNAINKVSNSGSIISLGDVKMFLQGFKAGDSLYTTIDKINQEMLRFEKTGEINN